GGGGVAPGAGAAPPTGGGGSGQGGRRRPPPMPTRSITAESSANLACMLAAQRGRLVLPAMLRCPRDQVKTLRMDAAADSGESTIKPTEPTCWSEVTPMHRIVIFLLGLLLGGGLMASVPPGKAHDDLTGALASPENHPLLLHMTSGDS